MSWGHRSDVVGGQLQFKFWIGSHLLHEWSFPFLFGPSNQWAPPTTTTIFYHIWHTCHHSICGVCSVLYVWSWMVMMDGDDGQWWRTVMMDGDGKDTWGPMHMTVVYRLQNNGGGPNTSLRGAARPMVQTGKPPRVGDNSKSKIIYWIYLVTAS